jgi:hypothetical protein
MLGFNSKNNFIVNNQNLTENLKNKKLVYSQFRFLFGSHRVMIPETFLQGSSQGQSLLCSESEAHQLKSILILIGKMLDQVSFLVNQLGNVYPQQLFHTLEQFESPFETGIENCNNRESFEKSENIQFLNRNQQSCISTRTITNYTENHNIHRNFCINQINCHSTSNMNMTQNHPLNLSNTRSNNLNRSDQSFLTNPKRN